MVEACPRLLRDWALSSQTPSVVMASHQKSPHLSSLSRLSHALAPLFICLSIFGARLHEPKARYTYNESLRKK